jgi:hypothetical protein
LFPLNLGLPAQAKATRHKAAINNSEVFRARCNFNKRCICFWDEDKEIGKCLESEKFRKKNAALEKAKKEAEYADSDEGKAAAKAKQEAINKGYEEENKADRRRKRELHLYD